MKNKYIKKSLPLVASIFTFAAIASVVGSVIVSKSGSTSLSSEAPTHINTPYAELITYEEQLNALQEEMNGLKAGISLLEKLDSLQTTMKVATTAMQDADSERTFAASAKSAASVAITTATTAKSSADADVTKAAKAVKDKEDIVNAANNVLKGVSTTDINKSSEWIEFYNKHMNIQIVRAPILSAYVPIKLPVTTSTSPLKSSSTPTTTTKSKIGDVIDPTIYIVKTPDTYHSYADYASLIIDDSSELDSTLTGLVRDYSNFIDSKNILLWGLTEAKAKIAQNQKFIQDATKDRIEISRYGVFHGVGAAGKNWIVLAGSHNKNTVVKYIDKEIALYRQTVNTLFSTYHLDTIPFETQTQQTITERDDPANASLLKIKNYCKDKVTYFTKISKAAAERTESNSLLTNLRSKLTSAQTKQNSAGDTLTKVNKDWSTADNNWKLANDKWTAANAIFGAANSTWNRFYSDWVSTNGELTKEPLEKLSEMRNELKTIQIEKYNPLYELYSSLYSQLGAI